MTLPRRCCAQQALLHVCARAPTALPGLLSACSQEKLAWLRWQIRACSAFAWVDVSPAVLEGNSCPYLHLPPFPRWAEVKVSHGLGKNNVVCHRVTSENTRSHLCVSWEQCGWPHVGYNNIFYSKTNYSALCFMLNLWGGSEEGPGRQWCLILISSTWYREKPVFVFMFQPLFYKAVHAISRLLSC